MRIPDEQARIEVLAQLRTRIGRFRLLSAVYAEEGDGTKAQAYGDLADGLRAAFVAERDNPEPKENQ